MCDVLVYILYGYDGCDFFLLVDFVGFILGGFVYVNWKNFGENVLECFDWLIFEG